MARRLLTAAAAALALDAACAQVPAFFVPIADQEPCATAPSASNCVPEHLQAVEDGFVVPAYGSAGVELMTASAGGAAAVRSVKAQGGGTDDPLGLFVSEDGLEGVVVYAVGSDSASMNVHLMDGSDSKPLVAPELPEGLTVAAWPQRRAAWDAKLGTMALALAAGNGTAAIAVAAGREGTEWGQLNVLAPEPAVDATADMFALVSPSGRAAALLVLPPKEETTDMGVVAFFAADADGRWAQRGDTVDVLKLAEGVQIARYLSEEAPEVTVKAGAARVDGSRAVMDEETLSIHVVGWTETESDVHGVLVIRDHEGSPWVRAEGLIMGNRLVGSADEPDFRRQELTALNLNAGRLVALGRVQRNQQVLYDQEAAWKLDYYTKDNGRWVSAKHVHLQMPADLEATAEALSASAISGNYLMAASGSRVFTWELSSLGGKTNGGWYHNAPLIAGSASAAFGAVVLMIVGSRWYDKRKAAKGAPAGDAAQQA